jgi:PAS domain S-box-containing protein
MTWQNYPYLGPALARFTAYFTFSAAVVTAIVLSLDHQRHLYERSRSEDRESLRLSLASQSITRDLREVITDLRFLSKLQILADYINTESPTAQTLLENSFVNVAESARIYDQVRFIDRHGREKIRVNFHAGSAVRVPTGQLQDKSQRFYVKDALKLASGDIYISRLDLNMEQGHIEQPFKPVIRVATPVFNTAHELKGIVVLNYLAKQLLNNFRDFMAGSWGEATLVNARGYWLFSPNTEDEWGFMLGHDNSFANRYPDAWNHIMQHDAGLLTSSSGLFMFSTARPYDPHTLRDLDISRGNLTERYWKLIERIPPQLLNYSLLEALAARSGELLGLMALVGVLSLLLAALRTKYVANSKALRESESRLAAAQCLAHMGNWVWNIPTGELSWSEETYNIFGLTHQHNISYEQFIAMVHPDDRTTVSQAIDAALQRKAEYDIEHRIVRADNTSRIVHGHGGVTFDKSGAPIRMFGTIQDVTERKAIENKLRDNEERFRQLAVHIDDVFWLTEWPQNRVIYVSPAFERIWGLTAQQLYEAPMIWTQSIVVEDRPRVEQVFMEIEASDGFDITYCILRPDGDARWIHDRAFLIRNAQADVYRIAGVASDITNRIKTEQELKNYKEHLEDLVTERTVELQLSIKALESLNYSLAHDLRAPLRAVTSFSQILSEEASPKLTAGEQDHIHRITKAGKHMALLLDGMSELGRISRQPLTHRAVDLSAIAQQVAEQLQRNQPQRSIEVQITPRLQCLGDLGLLTIAVKNLLENAWKNTANCPQAQIEFGVLTDDDSKVYFVRDNGIGFDMSHANHLFEPFQHFHQSDDPQGTGIGLAAVHRIIQRHRGRIWAESGENAGATFFFTLPAGRGARVM